MILASGGFAANPELVGRYIIGDAGRMRLRAHPWSTGDGFLAALRKGPSRAPDSTSSTAGTCQLPPQTFLRNGSWRSPNSTAATPWPQPERRTLRRRGRGLVGDGPDTGHGTPAGLCAWYVVDAGGSKAACGSGPRRDGRHGEEVRAGPSSRRRAQELAEARGTGVPARNASSAPWKSTMPPSPAGGRISRRRASRPRRPVRRPPFVAVEVAPAITHTVGGLAVDAGCRVLRRSDDCPPGLYAAGVEVGGVSAGGYTSGLASALVFGSTAAESAVADGIRKHRVIRMIRSRSLPLRIALVQCGSVKRPLGKGEGPWRNRGLREDLRRLRLGDAGEVQLRA